jgi:hypothetical protein
MRFVDLWTAAETHSLSEYMKENRIDESLETALPSPHFGLQWTFS